MSKYSKQLKNIFLIKNCKKCEATAGKEMYFKYAACGGGLQNLCDIINR